LIDSDEVISALVVLLGRQARHQAADERLVGRRRRVLLGLCGAKERVFLCANGLLQRRRDRLFDDPNRAWVRLIGFASSALAPSRSSEKQSDEV